MAKTGGRVVPSVRGIMPEQLRPFASARSNVGMITDLDSIDLPNEALVEALNARVRLDGVSRRLGGAIWTPAKPDSSPVLLLVVFKKKDGTKIVVRFAHNSINKRGVGAWTLLTTGTALTGTVTDRFQAATILDELCFTNGVDRVNKVNAGVTTYDPIAAAPKAKYITGFYNRLVVANYNVDGGNPAAFADVGWSADGNVTIFDPLVDPSAGRGPLVESPSDLGDYITGLFGGTNVLVVLREFSVWIATKNPVASNPFNFQCVVPGIGCNVPNSAVVTPGGLIWYDTTTKSVWAWSLGSSPERISFGKVEKEIARGITDPNLMFASFSGRNLEFALCKPVSGSSLVQKWIFNLTTKGWSFDEIEGITSVNDIQYGPTQITVDDLQGTVDQLVGTVDSLVAGGIVLTSHIMGKSDGDALEETDNLDIDGLANYTTRITSKDFKMPVVEEYVTGLKFEYECEKVGTLTLSYSKNRGQTYITVKSKTMKLGKGQLLLFSRHVRCRHFRWRLESSSGLWSLTDYEVYTYPGGKVQTND